MVPAPGIRIGICQSGHNYHNGARRMKLACPPLGRISPLDTIIHTRQNSTLSLPHGSSSITKERVCSYLLASVAYEGCLPHIVPIPAYIANAAPGPPTRHRLRARALCLQLQTWESQDSGSADDAQPNDMGDPQILQDVRWAERLLICASYFAHATDNSVSVANHNPARALLKFCCPLVLLILLQLPSAETNQRCFHSWK